MDVLWCPRAQLGAWHLGRLTRGTSPVGLLSWASTPHPVDAGVPQIVASIMAEALTSVVRVTFLASMGSSKQRGDLIRRDRDVEWTEAPASGIDRTRRYLLSTIEPQTVLSAFDDPDHPWWMQAQIFCLSDRNTDPPALDHATARGLCGDGWVEDGQMLIHLGLKGIMRPGVDGDVAGLWTSEQSYNSAILGSLESHVRRAGHQWIELDEDNFMQRLASYG